MIGCAHSFQLWEKIHSFFHNQTRAKSTQLRTELRSATLGNRTISEFLLQIKSIIDSLFAIGDPISPREHLDVILQGLPSDYEDLITLISTRFEEHSIDELEALLLAKEARLGKYRTPSATGEISVNVALSNPQPSPSSSAVSTQSASHTTSQGESQDSDPMDSYDSSGHGRGSSRGRGARGRGRGRSSIQCQLCYKFGHDVWQCYHRFNPNFVPQKPPQNSPQNSQWNSSPQWHSNSQWSSTPQWNSQWSAPVSSPWQHSSSQWPPRYPPAPSGYAPMASSPGVPYRGPAPSPMGSAQAHAAFQTSTSTPQATSPAQPWYPDSGASHHVTSESQNVHQFTPFAGQDQLFVGNGQGLPISGIGSSTLSSGLVLNNLLHVPSITKNLVSVSKFARDNGVFFEFHPYYCCVKSQASSKVLLQGSVGADGLYKFHEFKLSHLPVSLSAPVQHPVSVHTSVSSSGHAPVEQPSVVSSVCTANLWHFRLGHPSLNVLRKALQFCKIPVSNKMDVDFCKACVMGKSHRLPSSLSTTEYTSPLELVYSDLWGPSPSPSSSGYLYYITFIDAYSRYTWIYLLKAKSEAISAFHQFKASSELQLNAKIKALQTDWGGEFRVFPNFLKDFGIHHRLICPHTHHQNGVVERKHRHIVDLGLSLLAHASIPLTYWDFAFSTAVYLINRLPTSSLQFDIPLYKLFKQIPDYTFLKVFGCSCFPLMRPYNSHKLDFRSQECVFLGYSPSHRGYKCLASSGRIYISKDVIFDENTFPYPKLFAQNSNSPSLSPAVVLPSLPSVEHFS